MNGLEWLSLNSSYLLHGNDYNRLSEVVRLRQPSKLQPSDFFGEFRQDGEDIADQSVIGDLEDGG
ncbi:hypothetical protein, partial [Paracoccus niistensis]